MSENIESTPMFKFKRDLYASFGIGFLIGLGIVGAAFAPGDLSAIPQAVAATVG
ncbi:hypothetical protein [Altererythrobacter sp. MTPC7]|uniref:hypothetical protein n=1 Tax=Altererythrobacter sp. MTPC7 TaxID=3056567 RepID=UPI0036F382C0